MAQKIKKLSKKFIALVCMFTLVFSYSVVTQTKAAALTTLSDTLSDSRASETYVKHSILFKVITAVPSVTGKIVIDFPAGFDLTTQGIADLSLKNNTANPPTTARTLALTTPTATADGVVFNFTDDTITITMCSTADATCAMEANDYVLLTIGDGAAAGLVDIVNPATGVYITDIDTYDGATALGGGSVAVAVITSGVSVSATIDAYITFSSNDYAVGFGSWTGGSVLKRFATSDETGVDTTPPVGVTDPFQLTVSTNATGGASITARSVNGQLTGSTGDLIATLNEDAIASAAEGYGLYFSAAANGFTVDAAWDDSATGTLSTSAQVVATSTATALSSATIDGELAAAISATTLAGVYSDTLVFVATATY